jgi:hypothetical protein
MLFITVRDLGSVINANTQGQMLQGEQNVGLNYEVSVEGVEIDGHPLSIYASSLDVAAAYYDLADRRYPYNKVVITELVERVIKESNPQQRPLVCPRGCTGNNNKEVVKLGSNDKAYCTTCGWRET